MELGVRVVLREVETLEDAGEASAPSRVVPGDLVATELELFRVESSFRWRRRRGASPSSGRRVGYCPAPRWDC